MYARNALANLRKHFVHYLLIHAINLGDDVAVGVRRIVDVHVAHKCHHIPRILSVNGKTRFILELLT
jgi:hypothetical protein